MKAKYAPGTDPLRKEQSGFTFRNSPEVSTVSQGQRNDRHRRPAQWQRMKNLERCVKAWREFTPQQQQAWKDFAFNYPVPTRADGNKFLNGYQLFVKRNYYCALNFTFQEDLLIDPGTPPIPEENIDFSIEPSDTVIDATQLFIDRFGVMPKVGDFLYLRAIAYGEQNGFFYKQFNTRLEVLQVPLDGLFISVIIPKSFRNASVSVYLSRPYSPGREFFNSEVRYMGCFTAKTFLQLQDTPDSYEHEAGNIVVVNPGEDGLEFVKPTDIPGLGGAKTFLELTDTPNSYAGEAGKIPAVNQNEDGLEFISPPQPGGDSLWEQEPGYIRQKTVNENVQVGINDPTLQNNRMSVYGAISLYGRTGGAPIPTNAWGTLYCEKFGSSASYSTRLAWRDRQGSFCISQTWRSQQVIVSSLPNQPLTVNVPSEEFSSFTINQENRDIIWKFGIVRGNYFGTLLINHLTETQNTFEIAWVGDPNSPPEPIITNWQGKTITVQMPSSGMKDVLFYRFVGTTLIVEHFLMYTNPL